MSLLDKLLLDPETYKRPDAEVLPLITHATARAKDRVRRISHQRCCARRAGHRPLSRAALRGTLPVCRPAGRAHAPSATGSAWVRPSAAADRRRFDCSPRAPRAARRGSAHPNGEAGRVSWRGDGECALTGGRRRGWACDAWRRPASHVCRGRSVVCSDCSRDARRDARGRAQPRGRRAAAGERPQGEAAAVVRLCTFAIARAPRPLPGSARAPRSLARLIAQSPHCSLGVPRTGREDATPQRRSVQLIGGGGAGAARGVPGGRQGDGQGTPPPAPCATRLRPLPHPPPASWLSRPSARLVCHVYRTRRRHSTAPLSTAHRCRWCRRCSRRTRRPPRR